MKKIIGFILSLSMLLQVCPVFATEAEEEETNEPKPTAFKVEAENAEVVEGLFKVETGNAKYSGGGGVGIYEFDEQESLIEIPFTVDVEGNYDMHVLATAGNVLHLSAWKWKLDDAEDWSGYSGVKGTGDYGYGIYSVAVEWIRLLNDVHMTAGEHKLSFKADKKRDLATDFMLCFFDCAYFVPTEWKWMPYNLTEAYDEKEMKFEYVDGKISAEKVKLDQKFTVTVNNACTKPIPCNATLRTELRYKGETVRYEYHQPMQATKSWKVGKKYQGTCELWAPFNAPDGMYEVWTGFLGLNYADGEEMHKVGDIQIGEIKKNPEMGVVKTVDFDIPETIERGTDFDVTVRYSSNVNKKDLKPYLAFYQGKELWYVAESEAAPVNVTEQIETEKTFKFKIKEDVPDGEYKVVFGYHTMDSDGKTADVTIDGGTFEGEWTYKPLAYGKYAPQKTGNTHLWYVNQTHHMIWDGKPFIPIGGMYCSNYVISFSLTDEESNKARWKDELARLDMFKEKGIKHFYINSNRGYSNSPGWFWEKYFETLDEYGFTYGLQLVSSVRQSQYYSVRAQEQRIETEATESGLVSVVNNAQIFFGGSAIETASQYLVIDQATGEAVDNGKGTYKQNKDGAWEYTADIKVPKKGNYKVYFTPWTIASANNVVDPFNYRDDLEKMFTTFTNGFMAGDGFRTVVDPLTNESGFTNWVESIKFEGGSSHEEYVKWLKEKYDSIDELNESWAMADRIPNYDVAADLLPLYTNLETETIYCQDVQNNRIYKSNSHYGLLWDDYITFREYAAAELNNYAADMIKSNGNSCVPVIIKHISILEDYNVNKHTDSGIDGLGGEIYGDLPMATAKRTYGYSEIEQAARTQWFPITECNTEENMTLKTEQGPVCYESEEYMHQAFDEHMADGATGIYDFVIFGDFFSTLLVYSYHSKPEAYTWSKNYREKTEKKADKIANTRRENGRKQLYFYPGGQSWWLMPNKRNAVLPNDDYAQTRPSMFNDRVVLQTFNPFVDKEILFANLTDAPASKNWGGQLNEYVANIPDDETFVYMGLRKDLGEIPEVDKYFTDEFIQKDDETIQVLKPTETSEVIFSYNGKPWAIKDGNIYIVANTGCFTGPLPTTDQYTGMKYVDQLGIVTKEVNSSKEAKQGFTDIDKCWAKADILKLYNEGIVSGIGNNLFAPTNNVTRAELLQMLFQAIKLNKYSFAGCYDDVNATDWYASVMQTANEVKIIPEEMITDKNIYPTKAITREETASIISQLCASVGKTSEADLSGFTDANNISNWAATDMENLVGLEIMSGNDKKQLNPQGTLTRAEAVSLVKRFMGVYLK